MIVKYRKIIALLSTIFHLPLLYLTFKIVATDGGPMGWGFMALPFLIISHLFLIPAGVVLLNKSNKKQPISQGLNIVGIVISAYFGSLIFYL